MSHHQNNDHHRTPDHDVAGHYGRDHRFSQAPLSFSEKLSKLLNHWIKHNDHHAQDYRKWAQDARENHQLAVADLLESAADLTDTISDRFREAGGNVHPEAEV